MMERLTTREFMTLYRISERTARVWRAEGKVKTEKIGGKVLFLVGDDAGDAKVLAGGPQDELDDDTLRELLLELRMSAVRREIAENDKLTADSREREARTKGLLTSAADIEKSWEELAGRDQELDALAKKLGAEEERLRQWDAELRDGMNQLAALAGREKKLMVLEKAVKAEEDRLARDRGELDLRLAALEVDSGELV